MDITTLLSSIPAALLPIALVLFFSDQNTKKWMEERKEIALAILTERKEWLVERKDTIERQFTIQEKTVVAIAEMKAEDHAQRNTLTGLTTRIETMDLRIQALSKGGSAQ